MIARVQHFHDERLCDCYYVQRAGDPLDPPVAEHLIDCPKCGARYAELSELLDAVRDEADASADEVFTPERLATQRQQIAHRLEAVGRAPRVIAFPGHAGGHPPETVARQVARHWTTAAAAAGLFIGIGIGTGLFFNLQSRATHTVTPARQVQVAPATSQGSTGPVDATDEAFLSELEVALDRPHTRELLPFDALTPHVREVSNTGR